MAKRLFANNAGCFLGTAIVTTGTLTTITVETGKGGLFPAPTGGDWFDLTIEDTSGNVEIFRIVGRSGDILTVGSSGNARGLEGTTARTFATSAILGIRITAATLGEISTHLATDSAGVHPASGISFSAAGALSSTTVQAALEELDTEKLGKAGGTLTGAVTISSGGLTITTGGLTVSGGGAAVTGNSTITGTLGVSGALTVSSGGAAITGALSVSAGLTVSGGGAAVTGNSSVTGTLSVSGAITLTSGVAGNAYATGNLRADNGFVYLKSDNSRFVQWNQASGRYQMDSAELLVNGKWVANDVSSTDLIMSISSSGTLTANLANVVTGATANIIATDGTHALTWDAKGRITGYTFTPGGG